MRSSLATILVALASLQTAISAPHRPTGPRYLNDLAQGNGKLWFGTAADIPGTGEQTDKDYLRILTNPKNFGEITPANMMKVSVVLKGKIDEVLIVFSSCIPSPSKMCSTTQEEIMSSVSLKRTECGSDVTTSSGPVKYPIG